MPIIKQCALCGKEIKVSPSKNSQYNFCNRDCYNKFHKSKNKKIYKCEFCGKEFESINDKNANRFCSRECYNEAHKIKNKKRKCLTCGKYFMAKASEDKYCSRKQKVCSIVSNKQNTNRWAIIRRKYVYMYVYSNYRLKQQQK